MIHPQATFVYQALNSGKVLELPDLGFLCLNYLEAHIHPVTRIFSPPKYTVILTEHIDEKSASILCKELAAELLAVLAIKDEYFVEGVGCFMKTKTEEFVFEPDQALLIKVNEVLGILPEFSAQYVDKKPRILLSEEGENTPPRKKKKLFWFALLILFLFIGGFVFLYMNGWLRFSNQSQENLELNKEGKAKVVVEGNDSILQQNDDSSRNSSDEIPVVKTEELTYHIIIGSFTERGQAIKDSEKWIGKGYHPNIIPFEEKGRFRLSIEHYKDSVKAKEALLEVRNKINSGAWILKK